MMEHAEFMETVKKGARGDSVWLPLQQEKLGSKISVTQNMYFLFGGLPGSGKTAIVDSVFLLDIFDWWKENKESTKVTPYWIYRSMERTELLKRAKWLCYKMYKDYGVLIDVPTVMQWSNKLRNLTDEDIGMMESYNDYFNELFEYVDLKQGAENPTGVYNYAVRHFEDPKNGIMHKPDQYTFKYEPNDPNKIVFHITDHIGKLTAERDLKDKGILDKHSEYMGILRDRYGAVIIDISQLNRNIEDTIRGIKTELDIQPKDFKGSADMFENADVVIGLMNPYKLGSDDYMGYDINKFVNEKGYNRFRGLKVIKNSYGIDDFRIGYAFLGENGMMKELPKASEMSEAIYHNVREGEKTKRN